MISGSNTWSEHMIYISSQAQNKIDTYALKSVYINGLSRKCIGGNEDDSYCTSWGMLEVGSHKSHCDR